MKWYGNLNNRVEENRMFTDTIEVGTGATVYHWSDRDAYEVTKVIDQKHLFIRELKHTRVEGTEWYENRWNLESDETRPETLVVKRGKYWYTAASITPEEAKKALDDNNTDIILWAAHHDICLQDVVDSNRTKTRFNRINISFGKADYYYDPSF